MGLDSSSLIRLSGDPVEAEISAQSEANTR